MIALPQSTSPHCSRAFVTVLSRVPVYFFLDFWNIALGAKQLACQLGDLRKGANNVRLHARNFRKLAQRDRLWKSGYAAAGFKNVPMSLCRNFERAGIRFDHYEAGCNSLTEQGIDRVIQGEMRKLQSKRYRRGVVVLATGDGNGHQRGDGFLPALEDLKEANYSIELMSWEDPCNPVLRDWCVEHGKVIMLDDWYVQLTFIEGGRPVSSFAPHCWLNLS